MRKTIKNILVSILTISILASTNIVSINNINAENVDNKDTSEATATLREGEVVTTMDENGNVYPLDEIEASMPEESNDGNNNLPRTRSASRISSSSIAVVNFRTKSSNNYNTEYKEVGTDRSGYTNGYYAADGAFLGYDNDNNPTKVKFMQAGIVGWVNINEVQVLDYTSSAVNTLSKYYVKNGRVYHGVSTNLANSKYGSSLDYGPKPSYLKEGMEYYSYDGHYFYEGGSLASYTKMINDYKNSIRTNSVNSNSPYYNYYEYLSHRTVTTYSAKQLNSAIAKFAPSSSSKMLNLGATFINNQNAYGTNALLMIGVAANESAWGTSNIANTKNNLFGHGAVDSNPLFGANGYSSVEDSVYYHSAIFVSKGYLDPVTDARYYGANLGDKASGMAVKYASDPYWGEKAAAICWLVDSYLGGNDSKKYTIGIKDTINTSHSVIDIKNDASSGSSTLYSTYPVSSKTSYKKYAPSNYSFVILDGGEKNNYYKIQSDGAVNSNRNGILVQSSYSYEKGYGYIPKSSITIIHVGNDSNSIVTTENNQNTDNVMGQPTGKENNEPIISYSANSQTTGWLDRVIEPNTAGTTGRSLDLYQLRINLTNINNTVALSGKVYSNGSWLNYDNITSSSVIGNANNAMQVVNFSIKGLSGYRLEYRVHSADIGWQKWITEGNNAGVSGKNIQAIDFRLVPGSKLTNIPALYYQAHVENEGWLKYVGDNEMAGTVGESLSFQAFRIGINNMSNHQLTVKAYDKSNGWTTYDNVTDKTIIGSTGKSLPLQAINATLSNSDGYEIEYKTHLSNLGWSEWTSQGKDSGVTSGTNVIEAVMFRIVKTKYPASINLNKTSVSIYVKGTETLKANLTPTNIENKTVTWSSSDSNIAKVDANGKVTGVNEGTATITAKTANGKIASCNVTVTKQTPSITYQTHIQDIGWQDWKNNGSLSGTTGQAKQIEAIKIKISNNTSYTGSIQYQTHVQDIGWQDWSSDGSLAGTTGQAKQIEAIRIKLTSDLANNYDVYYRVHAQEFGWLDWAENGKSAGTAGFAYRLEAIEIKLQKKGLVAPGNTDNPYMQKCIGYSVHVQDIGWQARRYDAQLAGTTGQAKQLEAIKISLENPMYSGNVEYSTHIQDIGWQNEKKNGELSGTTGQAKQLEAIRINLTGEMKKNYDVYYRVNTQDYGWLDWASNGNSAGTEGLVKRLEAIQVLLVEKGKEPPGSTDKPFISK